MREGLRHVISNRALVDWLRANGWKFSNPTKSKKFHIYKKPSQRGHDAQLQRIDWFTNLAAECFLRQRGATQQAIEAFIKANDVANEDTAKKKK